MMIKFLTLSSVIAISLFSLQTKAQATATVDSLKPALIEVEPDHIYTPQGFDDNDNAQIVLDGVLPNTCYRIGPTSYKVDDATKTITVKQIAYYYSSSWCPQVPVEYTQTLDLGILAEGNYSVVLEAAEHKTKHFADLPIGVSTTSSPDENLYAPLSSAHLEKTPIEKKGIEGDFFYTLKLNGTTTTNCMSLKNTLLLVRSNNVIEILPIMDLTEKTSTGEKCQNEKKDFTADVSLKQIAHGRYLLHIRSLNGKSFNLVSDL